MVLYTGISHWLELVDEEDATTINVRLLAYGDGNDFPELTQTVTSSPVINSAVGQSRIVAHYVDQSNKAIDAVASSWGWPADNSAGETPSPDYTPNPKTIPGYSLVTDPAVLGNFATSNNISGQVLASPTAIPFPSTGQTDVYYVYNLNTYTVSFDSNGGSNVDDQTVSHDHTANEPNNPTKDNHSFVGWYLNPDLTGDPYDFNTPVTGDLTLYAKWQAVINPAVPIQPAPNLPSAPNAGLQFIASSLAWIVSGLGSLAATVLLIVNRFLRRMNSLRTNLLAMLCLSRLAPTAQIKPVDERVTLDSFCTTPFNFST